ncbi:N2227-like protein-domain-containing protein [Kockovaella imperatae]|uniref:carnosine N-methyltransferase n=1 Tax=Kockovaella imperatae TaxID=4999 RepID=A0A1Y1UVH4_9TREE|nr:N2227-like protein-domain-containing protein [Kockovaella imperatae]ORX41215.1 N2227-like protein-domain-containing protein [Kockovaella imperatae]
MADSPEERAHWRAVLKAYDGYMQYHLSANHARRMAFLQLPKEDKEVYEHLGFREKLEAVDEGIRRNAEFIDEMIADPLFAEMIKEPDDEDHGSHTHGYTHGAHSHSHGDFHSHDHGHGTASHHPQSTAKQRHENDVAQDKVRSTLRSFVRDWSKEGKTERETCYVPILEALERLCPLDKNGESSHRPRSHIRVLVPGCGLGRLAMEIAAAGFSSQGNEFSTYMLLASHFVLNQTTAPDTYTIFPFLHSFSNHLTTSNHLLRRVHIPDVCPAQVLGSRSGGDFSLIAGDFEDIYGPSSWDTPSDVTMGGDGQGQRGRWGAVVTCFFLDCARNPLTFLRIIYTILEDGGVWINLGPLLWHFENSPTVSAAGDRSIELSLDEVKELARVVGFDLHEEKLIETSYTGIPDNMLRNTYTAAFWTARKRPKA